MNDDEYQGLIDDINYTAQLDERVTLEGCVCGECFDCPDGWHYGIDLPCSCTPDCILTEDETP